MKQAPERSGVFLCFEFLALFGGAPILILALHRAGILFLLLWLGGIVTYRASRVARPPTPPDLGRIMRRLSLFAPFRLGLILYFASGKRSEAERAADRAFWRMFGRFVLFGAVLTLATRFFLPGLFLFLPRHHPIFWVAIMVLYPVLSVWPQEVIYRRFLFQRYEKTFSPRGVIAASALAFGFAHIIFLNGVAVVLTLAGGAMFAADYARERSLKLACIEHSLYGCLIFTIGLGRFFYTGAAWHH